MHKLRVTKQGAHVDALFDRLATLLKSLFASDTWQDTTDYDSRYQSKSHDPFFDEAWEELDAFLRNDREKQEQFRQKHEEEQRSWTNTGDFSANEVDDALRVLGLTRRASFAEVKQAYKRLLKEHHPDRFAADPAAQKKATEVCAIYNQAYAILEKYYGQ
ncbi:MAG TPA: DnaJ domain-containing protein [Spirochaetales bacterium]|nr:DnaJ domain-containing protein [Spirochaetales bacterium]